MERTRKKRIPAHLDVRINRLHQAEGLDLSADGIYIYTRHTVIEGAIVELSISVGGQEYEIQAKVEHSEHGVGFGVSLMDMPYEMSDRLKSIVDKGGL